MKKNLPLILLCCTVAICPMAAQNCRAILNEAKAAFSALDFRKAFEKLQVTETWDYENDLLKERRALVISIFNAVDQQREDAVSNAKKLQESAQKVQVSENETQIALRKAEKALDSLNTVLDRLRELTEKSVMLLLEKVRNSINSLNFDLAVGDIETAKILGALPDSVNLTYLELSRSLLSHAREDLQRKDYKAALKNIKSAGKLNIQPDSVAAANQSLRHFLVENARLDIVHTDYDAAVEKINALHTLQVPVDTVLSLYFESAFCYTEVGRLDRAAGLLDTIAQLSVNTTVRALLQELAGKEPSQKRQLLRQSMLQLDPKRNNNLLARYFPPLTAGIPTGTLTMGGDSGGEAKGACQVTIAAFQMGTKELTFFEYDLFCAATKRPKPSDNGWGRGPRPVIDIDWYDAVAYCNWRSRQEDLTEVYVIDLDSDVKVTANWLAKGYRLPTESEWQFAAGNGEKHTGYSWGNDVPTVQHGGNVSDETAKVKFPGWETFGAYSDGFVFTAPTGSFQPNDFGLYDMTGNVWEWCWDRYELNYCRPNKNKNAAQGPMLGTERVLRGGSWGSFPKDCFVSNRFHNRPDTHNYSIGFRLARNEKTL